VLSCVNKIKIDKKDIFEVFNVNFFQKIGVRFKIIDPGPDPV
jgi:hypothetical protein